MKATTHMREKVATKHMVLWQVQLNWLERWIVAPKAGGSSPLTYPISKRRIIMNCYEEAELEARDLTCDICWKPISVREYVDNCGLCDACEEQAE